MRNIIIILILSIYFSITLGCKEDKKQQLKERKLFEIQLLLEENNFEAARIAAIESLDPDVRVLYHKADDNLGHASHLDVRCNERIETVLYDIVKKVPARNVSVNRDLYSELLNLYPNNKLYEKKFIFYDRKLRRSAAK